MYAFHTLSLRLTAARELGFSQTGLFILYQLGKRIGLWRILTPQRDWEAYQGELKTDGIFPDPAEYRSAMGWASPGVITPAEEIVGGQVTLFGGIKIPLTFTTRGSLRHWTYHESGQIPAPRPSEVGELRLPGNFGSLESALVSDIKFTWEPARFSWVFPLARAFLLTGDEKYAAAFWSHFEQFCITNPPNTGPNWASAQEVGLRLIAFTFAHRLFANSIHSTPERIARLGRAVAIHAARLPSTLLYARAQNNNHLLSEAAALYTAGLTLSEHTQAAHWCELGWKWFHHGLQTQIEADGTYSQHSTNYHRLMLQLALWVNTLAQNANQPFPIHSLERLAAATRWLLALCDPNTGRVPNLGPNDGAYIFPLTHLPFDDYRPVLQAASKVFLGQPAFKPGKWDEMSLWLARKQFSDSSNQSPISNPQSPSLNTAHCLLTTKHSRAYLRTARSTTRPGHADQLHVDLWWRGLNVALDPGTYLYNADPPWDNALTTALVHNTVTINNLDQMRRAGPFLYVDRAQAKIIDRTESRLVAEHDGYRKLGILHRRTVEAMENGWKITDALIHNSQFTVHNSPFSIRLHWLLPDWPWKIDGNTFQIESPFGWVTLTISNLQPFDGVVLNSAPGKSSISNYQLPITNLSLFRAGETLLGARPSHPTWGWYSPTYGVKLPALAFVVEGEGSFPIQFVTLWQFPE